MSRYTFEGSRTGLTIVVGWDNPLRTFFAQVWEGSGPPAGNLLLWVGIRPDVVHTVEALAERVSTFGDIPEEIALHLEDDYERRVEPSALQQLLAR